MMSHNEYQTSPNQHYSTGGAGGGAAGGDSYSTQEIRNQSYSSMTDGGGYPMSQNYTITSPRQDIIVDELPPPMHSAVCVDYCFSQIKPHSFL